MRVLHCAQVEVYDGTAAWLRSLELDDDALTKAIIGTIGDVDAYQLPDAKGHTALLRHVLRVSDAERQLRRDQILATTAQDFRRVTARRLPFGLGKFWELAWFASTLPNTCVSLATSAQDF